MSEDLRVLIVDDDFRVARLHAEYVGAAPGFAALDPVGTGAAAIDAARAFSPDLVLVDVYLPDADGIDILPDLDVDAFVLSAASDAASIARAFRRGALGYSSSRSPRSSSPNAYAATRATGACSSPLPTSPRTPWTGPGGTSCQPRSSSPSRGP
ncbi:DNA-binding NarL/FixJ family response regulator [Sinomonas atrocyanea]|uniref:response regulator n=1 Tax=Sinomonas atrocyanea TaxID=37927 RepID=UPI002783042C|nr:response regulator [Sinomonas atrocyanea]MDQ0259223.1 DNA-binding NarL/FixJ family response regulator [Sinomonas atrocyanea]